MEELPALPPLPRILAGPILRHVTTGSATVWLASSCELKLELRVLNTGGELISQPAPPDSVHRTQPISGQSSWRLGDQLWVTLLEACPASSEPENPTAFPADTLLEYDLFDLDAKAALDLDDVCLSGESRPGFFIPSQLGVIAYGSCRKAHGLSFNDDGQVQHKDSLALLTEQLEDTRRNLGKRPAMLFLIGDQIYADDVLPELMAYLQALALQLMGKSILLPEGSNVCLITDQDRNLVKVNCGLTSTSGHAHVLSFGEYAALYLVTFGNRVGFQFNADGMEKAEALTGLEHFDPNRVEELERHSLQSFLHSQPQIRKAFANIITYLNFDDHDITDDWNLCRSWYDTVGSSPDGKRVISNGLAAYWAFQAWGNSPPRYHDSFVQVIKGHLDNPDDAQKAAEYDFHLWKFRRWSFMLPTNPPIFVLDSRTQRDFGSNNEPPQLMDRYALDEMRGEWLDIARSGQRPIFLTGTPVFGFSSIEWLQDFLYRIGVLLGGLTGLFSASSLDVESWVANRRGFAFFLDTLLLRMNLTKATILSGDVHYSFANRATYTNHSNPLEPKTLQCLQLTSSAMRNTPPTGRLLETFLANWTSKTRRGPCSPETLPWWERVFVWRLFRYNTWTAKVHGIPGRASRRSKPGRWWRPFLLWRMIGVENRRPILRTELSRITSRPNLALVHLRDGEVVRQVLLSGDKRENNLIYHIPPDV
ncbi:hypothetical protein VSS37_04125 [Candidatus Thiothrix sp. Deng01]|uniref:PhoD-like phosphatase metallophosphatase domain-containing protein n=1 Tax=Candidatus Thiothrix phosphatis TaxID=3112415 RepID=A0ABU6CTR2_9GAMM|nr:hypothetical protein [Candidatus Thiothrix sp. Deng01]MEB4590159.1 hypothetical protein [Candidatus Thiothrix sp. Deng01]